MDKSEDTPAAPQASAAPSPEISEPRSTPALGPPLEDPLGNGSDKTLVFAGAFVLLAAMAMTAILYLMTILSVAG